MSTSVRLSRKTHRLNMSTSVRLSRKTQGLNESTCVGLSCKIYNLNKSCKIYNLNMLHLVGLSRKTHHCMLHLIGLLRKNPRFQDSHCWFVTRFLPAFFFQNLSRVFPVLAVVQTDPSVFSALGIYISSKTCVIVILSFHSEMEVNIWVVI